MKILPVVLFVSLMIAAKPVVCQTTILLQEDFSTASGTTPPAGWSSTTFTGLPAEVWRFENLGDRHIGLNATFPYAVFDGDKYWQLAGSPVLPPNPGGQPYTLDAAIQTPSFNAPLNATIILQFKQYFRSNVAGGTSAVIEAFNGTTWSPVDSNVVTIGQSEDPPAPNPITTIDITKEVAGVTGARLRFRFRGDPAWYWHLDDIIITSTPIAPADRLIFQNFSTGTGTTPPSGWTQNPILGQPADRWNFLKNPVPRTIKLPMSRPAALFDSDYFSNDGLAEDVALESPQFSPTASSYVQLKWDQWYDFGNGSAAVEVYNGTSWVQKWVTSVSTSNPDTNKICNITQETAGIATSRIRFRFKGNFAQWWIVDNVEVLQKPNLISVASLGVPLTESFNSVTNTTLPTGLPIGWYLSESGTNANTSYIDDTGTSATGNMYSYGTVSTERALGSLADANLTSKFGAKFTNNSGSSISTLDISYTGEQWRLGSNSRGNPDSLIFEISVDATSLASGTWTAVQSLNFRSPVFTGTVGALNGNLSANQSVISATITGLNVVNGQSFWIRWTDPDIAGVDDGLAVDDFSLTPRSGALPAGAYSNLAVLGNNSLAGNVSVTGKLTLTNGKLTLGANNVTAPTISGGSSSNYIVTDGAGVVIRNAAASPAPYPIGPDATSYNPVTITNGSAVGTFSAKVQSGFTGLAGPSLPQYVVNRVWTITEAGGSKNATLLFQYKEADENSPADFSPLSPYISRYNGSQWITTTATGAALGGLVFTASASGFTAFSSFSIISNTEALPIQLASFTGTYLNSSVRLDWVTVSEVNNYGFYIEKKAIGETSWSEITSSFIPGHGTTSIPHSYSFTDNAGSGSAQYRLKQVDLDGAAHFTEPINVRSATSVKELAPIAFALKQNFPNPFNPETSIKFSVEQTGHAKLEVYNIVGQMVAALFDDAAEAGQFYSVKFDATHLASGMYFYRLQSGKKTAMKKLLVLK